MNYELQIIFPLRRPSASDEIIRQWIDRYYVPNDDSDAKLWDDHAASFADYLEHKRRHPSSRAGSMVALYEWRKPLLVAIGAVTFNPIMVFMALMDKKK